MYNCSVGNAPSYLTELLSRPDVRKFGLRSNDDFNTYNIPFNKNKSFSDRSFSFIGPKLWNQLPLQIQNAKTVDEFKKCLKTHYFNSFYELF